MAGSIEERNKNRTYPDLHLTVEQQIGEGEWVVGAANVLEPLLKIGAVKVVSGDGD